MQKSDEFVPVPGWPEYEISRVGVVRRVKPGPGTRAGRPLSPRVGKNGYLVVPFCRDGVRTMQYLHRLLVLTFIGDPSGFLVCHCDDDKLNNSIENLRIDTFQGNANDAVRHGRTVRGEKQRTNKYSEEQIREIRRRLDAGERQRVIALEICSTQGYVSKIKNRQVWGWL